MKDSRQSLHRLLQDARRDWGMKEARRIDWNAVDRELFARIEADEKAERDSLAPLRRQTWKVAVAGLAAAAAIALVAGRTHEPRSMEVDRPGASEDAATVVGIEGDGQVLVGGRPVTTGATLRLGDVIEARGAQAILSRPGKLTIAVERGALMTVTRVQGALVLALAAGAVEAQVVPVASGEALAVDVGSSRVAVHGTHLRVARAGERVVVDLNEGVVSLGAAPRVGSTLGVLVAASAHAEFNSADMQGTLRVSHDPALVRPPATLSATPETKAASAVAPPTSALPRVESREAPTAPAVVSLRPEPRPAANTPAQASITPAPDPNAQSALAAAVRTCMAERLHADDVTVVVSTTLYLELRDDGLVRSANFNPPVAPDINACAAPSIYKTRFTHGGAVTIPVSVKN
jgi:ferric-dicitrate binding protein FerR (iron transport regulator)